MVVSLRIASDLVERIDRIASETGRTRNEIMQTCIEFAVENLEID